MQCDYTSGEGHSELEKSCLVMGEKEPNVLEMRMRVTDFRTHCTLGFGNAVCGTGVEEHSLESCRWEKRATVCHTNITQDCS